MTRPSIPSSLITGLLLAVLCLVPATIAAGPGDRTIRLYNIHTKETLEVTYRKAGRLLPDAKKKIDWLLRDWRRDAPTEMDIRLIDLLWEIHRELGSRQPIHIISGYRSPKTNTMLRKTRGGQAKKSRHMTGEAADVHFPDIPLRELRYSALIREQGGVGYYPTSAIPFVHVDTGRVRAWPRLPRDELALLFPSGRTQHRPASGPPISRIDSLAARRNNANLAQRIAAFHDLRTSGRRPTLVAGLDALPNRAPSAATPKPAAEEWQTAALPPPPRDPMPKLIAAPRIADRPAPKAARPSEEDRRRLTELAALASEPPPALDAIPKRPAPPPVKDFATPPSLPNRDVSRFAFAASWVAAPEYDDEHPGELSYRPFPIRPYLTRTVNMVEPHLVRLTYRASAKVFALLEEADNHPALQIRPDMQVAEAIVRDEAKGRAIDTAEIASETRPDARLPSQRVGTTNWR
ncbi:MAG: hypothetical protein RLZ98_3040 [Pseudomonadota bacterium]|jgi:uncharacterized protein YcbK (DUF882 family)